MRVAVVSSEVLSRDGVGFCWGGRTYNVPFNVAIRRRSMSPGGRDNQRILSVDTERSGRWSVRWSGLPRRTTLLSSLAKDYQLDDFLVDDDGKGRREPRGHGAPKVEAESVGPCAVIVVATIAGFPIEVVDGEWVTLRSLFEPFDKVASRNFARLQTWADMRKVRLPPRMGSWASDGNFISDSWTIHRKHVAQAIGEISQRGMSDNVRTAFARFKRQCAAEMEAHFTHEAAVSPHLAKSHWSADGPREDASKVAKRESELGSARGLEAPARSKHVAQLSEVRMLDVLRSLGLPEDTQRGKRHHYRFAEVVFAAVTRCGMTWPMVNVDELREMVSKSVAKMHQLGFAVGDRYLLQYHGHKRQPHFNTLLDHMLRALIEVSAKASLKDTQASLNGVG